MTRNSMQVNAWTVVAPREPMIRQTREEVPAPGEVIVQVVGCGVCHTDLGFFYDGVPTRHGFPLTLGHEVSGQVVQAHESVSEWVGSQVIVPAVMPCGSCDACRSGRGAVCPKQIFPGNDVHGGFASHLKVPALGLCKVPDLADPTSNPAGVRLATLAVIADAVTTPYQALLRSGLGAGDLAVFVGAGGVGGFGVQIAAALGAVVVAIDIDEKRLALVGEHGAHATLRPDQMEFRALKKQVRAIAEEHGVPTWRRRIFEASGTAQGQTTAFGLLEPGGYLSIIGFTPDKVQVRLSNLMAFDATVQGNWGCLPDHYPAALDLVLHGKVKLEPFVEQRSLDTINQTFEDLHEHRVWHRIVLTPES